MTREEAIKALKTELNCLSIPCENCDCATCGYFVDEDEYVAACKLAISALREQPRWISVEERMPEDSRVYHVVCKYGPKRVVSSAKYKRGKWEEVYSRYPVSPWKVTHWMPLPSTDGLE